MELHLIFNLYQTCKLYSSDHITYLVRSTNTEAANVLPSEYVYAFETKKFGRKPTSDQAVPTAAMYSVREQSQ